MWDDLRIGIIGQGSQYIRISKILKSKDWSIRYINHQKKQTTITKKNLKS